jgi:DNA-binding CsgD family transcriptional regulator
MNMELSKREVEVLKLVANGKSLKEIGDKLFISPRTVSTHKENIKFKLGLDSDVKLTLYALRFGLIKV